MGNTFKKVLFSLGAIGLVWAGSLGMVSAQIIPQDPTTCIWDNCIENTWSRQLIDVIISFVNRVLGLLWVIAVIICLIWWFQMVTASWDETKYKKWFTILKQAWIWLVVIWLAWIIVRVIFWLIQTMIWNTWA